MAARKRTFEEIILSGTDSDDSDFDGFTSDDVESDISVNSDLSDFESDNEQDDADPAPLDEWTRRFTPITVHNFTGDSGANLPDDFDRTTATPLDYFWLLFSADLFRQMARNTNSYAKPDEPSMKGRLGAKSVIDRHDVDMEDWSIINKWMDKVINYILSAKLTTSLDYIQHGDITEELYSRTRPFMATLKMKHLLTVCNDKADKETIHCEFDITGSDLTWTSGDALGIYPQNNPPEVEYLIYAMHCSGTEKVNKPSWAYQEAEFTEDSGTLYEVLHKYYDLKSVKLDLVESLIDNLTDNQEKTTLAKLLHNSTSKTNNALQKYLEEREVADVLVDFSSHTLASNKILSCMKSLQPRYYSISSSPKKNSNEVCITVAVVRYTTLERPRTGVATTFVSDRLKIGNTCPVFMSRNPDFRLPSNSEVPVILIGPGTGIAPFIAFIQEREMETNCGPTWLYFGCRYKDKDYLYRSQLESWASKNVIRLSVAFSRDQDSKVYVQDHLKKDAREIWHLIDKSNASVFVCGDAKHMARDVHTTLQDILTETGGLDEKDAVLYLQRMEENSRYQKDVWVV